jgi:hypothetical protein
MFPLIIIKKLEKIFGLDKLDNFGGLLLPSSLKLQDRDFYKYIHLPVDWNLKAISSTEVPNEFSDKAVKIVDLFRRKTFIVFYEMFTPKNFITQFSKYDILSTFS